VDVGWYPEHDAGGRFIVRVFWKTWDRQKLPAPFESRRINDVVFAVEQLAQHFNRVEVPASQAKAVGPMRTVTLGA
jgi:hypothetical protein